MRHVIIGNGIAGISAAETIRGLDPTSSITIIARETFPPYCRPMISMLVEGSINENDMILRSQQFYERFHIDSRIGQIAQEIDVQEQVVRLISGEEVPFDRLLIATGAEPIRLNVDVANLEGIFFLRTREDALNISVAAQEAKRAVVIGGGLVGLKAAHALKKRGLKVSIVEKLPHLLPLLADEKAGELVERQAQAMGIEVLTSSTVKAFDGGPGVEYVVLDSGARIECDMVVVAVGVKPNVSFTDPDQISIKRGIVVNEFLETSVDGIYAAGDVAQVVDVVGGQHRLVPIWTEAVAQGRVAGMNMAGRKKAYEGVMARNVIRFEGLDLLSGGIIDPSGMKDARVVQWEDARNSTYRRYVLRDDRLVGAIMVNNIEQGGVVLSLIKKGTPLPNAEKLLQDPSFNFSKLLPKMG